MKKFIAILFSVLMAFSFTAGCKKGEDGGINIVDNRPVAYQVKGSDGEVYKEFNSLFTAIEYVVNECDYGDYVTKKDGDDNNVKLFTYKANHGGNTEMLYYYTDGNRYDSFVPMPEKGYYEDMEARGTNAVFLSGVNGLQPLMQGQKVIKSSTRTSSAYTFAVNSPAYIAQKHIESQVIVNLPRYSGVTKTEYEIKLTEAEIYPSQNKNQPVNALLSFTIADADYVNHSGLFFDTLKGTFHYFTGEFQSEQLPERDIEKEVVARATWNASKGCWIPNDDVVLTMENKKVDGVVTMCFTADFSGGKEVYREFVPVTKHGQAGTIRFNMQFDIDTDMQADFMNYAQFNNIVITKATATANAEMQDYFTYGEQTLIEEVGNFDLLNSNPESVMRNSTILSNAAAIKYNFDTPNRDVYSISYKFDANVPAYSSNITALIESLEAVAAVIPQINDKTITRAEVNELTIPARMKLNDASTYQKDTYQDRERFDQLLIYLDVAEGALLA